MASLGFNMTPSRADLIEDRRAYFAEYGAQRAAAVAERDGETDDAAEGDDEDQAIVTEPSIAVSLAELPTGAKAAMLAAAKNGWETQAWRTQTHVEPTFFKSTTESHNAGDIRFRAKDVRNYYVTAKAPASRLGFTASWSGENDPKRPLARLSRPYASALWLSKKDLALLTDKPEQNGSLIGATMLDPEGIEVELYFDYKETRASVLALGPALAKKRADKLDWAYNDKSRVRMTSLFTNKSTVLVDWIKKHHATSNERSAA
ncbi:hypothetical protein [Frigoribacterium sp. UYMn621]|uniref:hypothetical protein n=1 Tax=Frigoribacterium sp. UYMn621 TaxID=3156343 RepID=UPI0033976F9D